MSLKSPILFTLSGLHDFALILVGRSVFEPFIITVYNADRWHVVLLDVFHDICVQPHKHSCSLIFPNSIFAHI